MSRLRDLADAYYVVARDLEARAYNLNKMGENLFEIAGHLCEQHMRESAREPVPEPSGEETTTVKSPATEP